MKNILFICSANKDRSATAEHYFSEHYPNLNFDSAGTNEKICFQLGTTFITQELISWADFIFVMERKHQEFIQAHFTLNQSTRLTTVDIRDVYTFLESNLVEELKRKITPMIETLN